MSMTHDLLGAAGHFLAGGASGAAGALIYQAVRVRRRRRRLLRFHPDVRCPGHIPGSQQSMLADCPDAKAARR